MKYKLYYVKYGEAFCGRHTALKPALGKLNRFQKEWHASNKKGTTLNAMNTHTKLKKAGVSKLSVPDQLVSFNEVSYSFITLSYLGICNLWQFH